MDGIENSVIHVLSSGDDSQDLSDVLQKYCKQLSTGLPPEKSNSRQEIADLLIQKLNHTPDPSYVNASLAVLRFMSRDKNVVLKHMAHPLFVKNLRSFANLKTQETLEETTFPDIELNACRCLCNIIYLTHDKERLCSNIDFIKAISNHLQQHETRSCDQNTLALRFVFLISALSNEGRTKLIEECSARKIILDFLEDILQSCQDSPNLDLKPIKALSERDTNMCLEILKVIFNLNMDLRRSKILSQQELEELDKTLLLCSVILLSKSAEASLTEALHCSTGNAVYSVPPACFNVDKFLGVGKEDVLASDKSEAKKIPASENMKPVMSLLDILRHRVLNENLAIDVLHPLLALLSQLCRISRDIRVFVKTEILPPRKDFQRRPEEGNEVRSKIIKLFTHNNTDLKHGAADFLFVLCKEKVDRFVKYTGYGNAAGLLALRGLLSGGHGETIYSDTDSDSDTEEYKEVAEEINPVTGHIPPPRANLMEGMSDEQKEYLAVQLANDIAKLSSNEMIQPMCVGEDGNLIPFQQMVHETRVEESPASSDDDS